MACIGHMTSLRLETRQRHGHEFGGRMKAKACKRNVAVPDSTPQRRLPKPIRNGAGYRLFIHIIFKIQRTVQSTSFKIQSYPQKVSSRSHHASHLSPSRRGKVTTQSYRRRAGQAAEGRDNLFQRAMSTGRCCRPRGHLVDGHMSAVEVMQGLV